MAADVRLEKGKLFGSDLSLRLDALGYEGFWRIANGETPLMIASVVDARNAAAGLVSCGADVNGRDTSDGFTPLYYAAAHDSPDVAKLLIDRGAKVNMHIRYGTGGLYLIDSFGGGRPLHLAAWSNAPHVAKLLIDHDAEVNAVTKDGETPLHLAAQTNALHVAKLLIDHDAEVNAVTKNGKTPLDMSLLFRIDGEEMQALLRRHGGRCARRQC